MKWKISQDSVFNSIYELLTRENFMRFGLLAKCLWNFYRKSNNTRKWFSRSDEKEFEPFSAFFFPHPTADDVREYKKKSEHDLEGMTNRDKNNNQHTNYLIHGITRLKSFTITEMTSFCSQLKSFLSHNFWCVSHLCVEWLMDLCKIRKAKKGVEI